DGIRDFHVTGVQTCALPICGQARMTIAGGVDRFETAPHTLPQKFRSYRKMLSVGQRVSQSSVAVEGRTIGRIGHGLLVLLCAEPGDTPSEANAVLDKLLKLRIFSDENGRMNRSV